MSWYVLLDGTVAILLVLTIFYAVTLNRKLSRLRSTHAEFDTVASGFRDAVAKVEGGVASLKVSSTDLDRQMRQAETLDDDLSALIERGERVADRLEEGVRASRHHETRPPSAAVLKRSAAKATAEPRSQAERDLLKALAGEHRAN